MLLFLCHAAVPIPDQEPSSADVQLAEKHSCEGTLLRFESVHADMQTCSAVLDRRSRLSNPLGGQPGERLRLEHRHRHVYHCSPPRPVSRLGHGKRRQLAAFS